MGGITAFDPHLNQSVPLSQVHPSGSNASIELFNPFNFTSFFVENQQNNLTGQQLPYAPCVYCYFPLSGTYCTLNRILFLVEVIFALVTLFLDYIWLSSVAVAAVLNYTTIAAIHWIVLQCVSGNSVLDLDNGATSSIIEVGILLAYPLLQWSRLLRQKEWANTRYIIACWAVLLCLTSVIAQHRDSFSAVGTSQNYWPAAEVFFINFTVGTSFKNGPWYDDTVNALVLDVTEGHYQSLGDCTFATPYPVSALREGQALTPAPHLLHFIHTNSFSGAVEAFIAFSVITTIATVAATLHGRHTTGYVRAKLYLWLSTSGKGEWRCSCAWVLALFYYAVHFLVGIFSIPLAVVVFVINEVELEYYPGIDKNAYIGQWGPWVGAVAIFLAVTMNQSAIVQNTLALLRWVALSTLAMLHPRISRPARPHMAVRFNLFKKFKIGMLGIAEFFKDEHSHTIDWMRQPKLASKAYIEKEDKYILAHHWDSSHEHPHAPTLSTYGHDQRHSWGMP